MIFTVPVLPTNFLYVPFAFCLPGWIKTSGSFYEPNEPAKYSVLSWPVDFDFANFLRLIRRALADTGINFMHWLYHRNMFTPGVMPYGLCLERHEQIPKEIKTFSRGALLGSGASEVGWTTGSITTPAVCQHGPMCKRAESFLLLAWHLPFLDFFFLIVLKMPLIFLININFYCFR